MSKKKNMKTTINKSNENTKLKHVVTPLLRTAINFGINNRGKIGVGLAGITETVISSLNGDFIIPSPPAALDTMFLSKI